MTVFALRMAGRLVRLAFVLVSVSILAACGRGGVSAPPMLNTGPVSISPEAATLYSDLPTTFVVTGGSGTYLLTSSDQSVIPIIGPFTGNTITVVPASVAADTPITLNVRDTGGTGSATALLTVKPRTVSNTVTITPSASQSAACGSAICSGGDAEVRVVLSQSGIPLRNRLVRFDVVSGDFRIITSQPGAPETLALSGTTTTDDTGTARMRIRVLPDANGQTGLLQITDVSTGFTQRASLSIAPASNAPLNAQPSAIEFRGREPNTCASGIQADVIVFGGRPPYQISQPGSFTIVPTVVPNSGGRFTVGAIGQCSPGSQIAVVDANGATVTVTAANRLSEVPAPTPPTPTAFSVSPDAVTLNTCDDSANVALVGGTGGYFAASGNSAVTATVAGNQGTIRRTRPSGAVTSPINVAFSDGQTSRQVTVSLSPTGAAPCTP